MVQRKLFHCYPCYMYLFIHRRSSNKNSNSNNLITILYFRAFRFSDLTSTKEVV